MHTKLSVIYGKQQIKRIKRTANKEIKVKFGSLKELPMQLERIGAKLY